MQLSASEQHYAMAPALNPCIAAADLEAAGRIAKQQKVVSAHDHSTNPLSEAGLLQRILGYVGPGHWLPVAFVSRAWHKSYQTVPEQHIPGRNPWSVEDCDMTITCVPRITLLSAAVVSAPLMQLACHFGLRMNNARAHHAVGRCADTAALLKARELGVPYNSRLARGVARSGCLVKLQWLVVAAGGLDSWGDISSAAAASGNVAMLTYLSGSSSAAFQDGYAAAAGERQKISHHSGRYNEDRYQFVPLIQETYGRLGQKAASFVRELATHSAQCKGGSTAEIQRRYARVLVGIRSELSVTLARALAERVFAYVRGAVQKGRHTRPISAHLDFAGA
jgi:hypothetical protein